MIKHLLLILLFVGATSVLFAQNKKSAKVDYKELPTIRENSREISAVRKSNMNQVKVQHRKVIKNKQRNNMRQKRSQFQRQKMNQNRKKMVQQRRMKQQKTMQRKGH